MSETSEQSVSVRPPSEYDWAGIVDDLTQLLRIRTTPIGMKLFETVAEMEAVPRKQ